MYWASTPGRDHVVRAATAFNVISFIFFFTGFASPYWVQSWPRIFSGFQKIGLWEACFQGLVLPFDPREQAYYGCWWIFAPEYNDIRQYMMPWWFIVTQLFCTIVFTLMVINLIFHAILLINSFSTNTSTVQRRVPFKLVQGATVMTIINAVGSTFSVILFGVGYYLDRNWMPYRNLNYLSWSYGVVVVSTFFSIFASFALIVYNRIVRQEYREPGNLKTPLTGSGPSQPSSYNSPTYSTSSPPTIVGAYPTQPGYAPQASGYSPQTGGYPSQPGGYPSQPGGYPTQPGGYPSQSGGYPSQSGGYPSQSGGYPSQSGYSQSGHPSVTSYPGTKPSQPSYHGSAGQLN